MVNLTAAERRLAHVLVGWALDQDGDAIESDYLWFLCEEENPTLDDVDKVRDLLRGMEEKLK